MEDRRETPRTPLDEICILTINGRLVRARAMDVSDIGARLRILSDDPRAITDDDLGADARLTLRTTVPARACHGELIRRYFEDGAQYVGIRFWTKCREQDVGAAG
jgi:hypothetical protein